MVERPCRVRSSRSTGARLRYEGRWFVFPPRCRATLTKIVPFAADADGRALLDQGKRFWDPKEGKYAGHKDAVFDTVGTFFSAYAEDELNVQLGEDVKKLTKDLLMDSEGNVSSSSLGVGWFRADSVFAGSTSSSPSSGTTFARSSCPPSPRTLDTFPSPASSTPTTWSMSSSRCAIRPPP